MQDETLFALMIVHLVHHHLHHVGHRFHTFLHQQGVIRITPIAIDFPIHSILS